MIDAWPWLFRQYYSISTVSNVKVCERQRKSLAFLHFMHHHLLNLLLIGLSFNLLEIFIELLCENISEGHITILFYCILRLEVVGDV